MLGKLIKHDYKALSKTLWPTQIAIACATLIATGSVVAYISWASRFQTDSVLGSLMQIILVIVPIVMLLGIIASSFIVAFIIFNRYYKNLMGDEGYLSFTLPVTAASHLWAKLITAVIWLIISSLVIMLCVILFAFSATAASGEIADFYRAVSDGLVRLAQYWEARYWLYVAEFILLGILSAACQVLHIYLSITIGSLVAKKHKILAAVGFYFAISVVAGIFSSIVSLGATYSYSKSLLIIGGDGLTRTSEAIFELINTTFLINMAVSAVLSVVFFIVTHYLLKNKLNLD